MMNSIIGGAEMTRVVANIYEDTRALLNQVKEQFDFKSDDQAIKYLCISFLNSSRSTVLAEYLDIKRKKEQEG
jgi:hypothetical protein